MKYWIVPSNSKKFRMEEALQSQGGIIDWRCKNVSVGDYVFIYKTLPDGCIKYMFEVIKSGFTQDETVRQKRFWCDMEQYNNGQGIYVRLKLVDTFEEKALNIYALRKHGINGNIQTKRSCPQETLKFILENKL